MWLLPGLLPKADVAVPLDAAGSLGYGMFLKGFWFAGSRVPSQQQQSIAYKELFPAEIASQGLISSWLPGRGAADAIWSPSLAIYIMQPMWCGQADPSYIA